jgi:L-ascorbate metabolism protein UlaG (beta-lactamase superfamily)
MIIKVTRFVHSCLLVETDEAVAMFDPGIYSFESGLFNISTLDRLDYIAITHEHADHFHMPFVELLLSKFPQVRLITTQTVAGQLEGKGSVTPQAFGPFTLFEATHENLPTGEPPQNTGIHFMNVLSHPGDSHSFHETKRVLAMPMTAPWGSMTGAINKINELKPQVVVPIHDWHWKPEAVNSMYQRFASQLSPAGIRFIIPTDGRPNDIQLA